MELQGNAIKFIRQLGEKYNCTEEEAFSILSKENYGQPPAQFENGVIVSLNVPQLSSLFEEFSIDHESMSLDEFLSSEPATKRLNPNEIDISNLSELTDLYFKSLEKVDIPIDHYSFKSNTRLKGLRIEGYNVRSLDLKANKALGELHCSSNELLELDLTKNVKLERLECPFNNITKLDLSNNIQLRSVIIYDLPIHQDDIKFPLINKIEVLSIARTKISEINLGEFESLRRLSIGEKIESIDISTCKSLRTLTLYQTKLASLNISECYDLWELNVWEEGKIEELTCNEFQSFIISGISKKLKQKPSATQKKVIKTYQLHSDALSHNWDEGFGKLKRILKDENCDRATAIAIFWIGQPNYFLQFKKISEVPDHAREGYRFLNKLEKQLMDDFFQTKIISFNPKKHQNIDWTLDSFDPAKAQREINDKLKKGVIGMGTKEFDFTRKITIKYS